MMCVATFLSLDPKPKPFFVVVKWQTAKQAWRSSHICALFPRFHAAHHSRAILAHSVPLCNRARNVMTRGHIDSVMTRVTERSWSCVHGGPS
jgi:hypothetical protein